MSSARVVHATVTSGHGVQVIEALAGTGKTYTAGVLAYVYRRAGYEVLGVAPTGRAVRELVDEARIASRTLASMVLRISNGIELPAGCVVVLDEAGMAGTRETAVLLEAAARAGAKVVAIGDPGQLHSVQAGGWMRAVGRRVGVLRLSVVMRQRDHGERRALGLLHEGVPAAGLPGRAQQDRVELGGAGATAERAVREWEAAIGEHGPHRAVLIARSNDTRAALNERAREVVRAGGWLGEERDYGPVTVAVGDRVICRRNDREADVDNGTRGTVRAVHRTKVVLETDARTIRALPAAYVAGHVEHAYALTGHGMQGATVEWAGVVAAPHELTRGWSYTALSRARARTRLFVVGEGEAWAHHELARRDEHAPGEREDKPTPEQLAASVARYMRTRDDEDLAVEQLPAPKSGRRARARPPRATHRPRDRRRAGRARGADAAEPRRVCVAHRTPADRRGASGLASDPGGRAVAGHRAARAGADRPPRRTGLAPALATQATETRARSARRRTPGTATGDRRRPARAGRAASAARTARARDRPAGRGPRRARRAARGDNAP